MSTFSSISVLKHPTDTDTNWCFEFESVKFNMHDSYCEVAQEIRDFDSFFSAFGKLLELSESIDSNNGKLEKNVWEFVNQNNELSKALGLVMPYSFATEEEKEQAGAEVNDSVQKNIFEKAWDLLVRFFKAIGNALVRAYRWVINGFKSIKPKLQMAQRNWGDMSPDERTKFLNTEKFGMSAGEFIKRSRAAGVLIAHGKMMGVNKNIMQLVGEMATKPSDIYPDEAAENLRTLSGKMVNSKGITLEAAIKSGNPGFQMETFNAVFESEKFPETKTFTELGFDESTINDLFKDCSAADHFIQQLEDIEKFLSNGMANIDANQVAQQMTDFAQQFNGIAHVQPTNPKSISKEHIAAVKAGAATICNIFKAIIRAEMIIFHSEMSVLNKFRKSPEQVKQETAENNQ